MTCPVCSKEAESGYIYLRGIGGALFWSNKKDVPFLSRQNLEQVELDKVSLEPPRTQAVLPAYRCPDCRYLFFKY